jgi:hypothetical protein
MPQGPEETFVKKDPINLRDMARTVLKGWKTVAWCIGVFVVFAIIQIHLAPTVYAVQMQVTPVPGSNDQASSRVSSLSNLAQLAGISSLSNQSGSQFRLYADSLYSRALADDLAKNQDLMKSIFSGEWDEQSHSWREPERGFTSLAGAAIMSFLGVDQPAWQPPDGARLQKYLTNALTIVPDLKKPYLVTIVVNSSNPQFAIRLLTLVDRAADNYMRKKALLRATQYINYLSMELNTVTVAEHREAIMQTLSEQEKFKMSAGSAVPYAAEVFDKPWASLQPVSPRPGQFLLNAIVLGGLIGAAIVLGRTYSAAFAGAYARFRIRAARLFQSLRRRLHL